MNKLHILGIESSCDDTAAAIVSSDKEILSNIIINQNVEHAPYAGVVPEIAARAHMQNLEHAIKQATLEANISLDKIDAIAATSGPGLIGGVIVGCMFGKAIASVLKKPFIAVNHLEGHALSVRLANDVAYPYLLLLASGGHCQFIIAFSLGNYKIIGQTLDDAAGEAFDKVAKMLKLGFFGGPLLEARAQLGDPHKYILPKPIIFKSGCNLSFSGLKTATRLLIESLPNINEQDINDVAASFQYTVGEVFKEKLQAAIKIYQSICENKHFVLVGGVAANKYLRQKLTIIANNLDYQITIPSINLCTDNAAMIAWVGIERLNAGLINQLNFCPRARWSLEELA